MKERKKRKQEGNESKKRMSVGLVGDVSFVILRRRESYLLKTWYEKKRKKERNKQKKKAKKEEKGRRKQIRRKTKEFFFVFFSSFSFLRGLRYQESFFWDRGICFCGDISEKEILDRIPEKHQKNVHQSNLEFKLQPRDYWFL